MPSELKLVLTVAILFFLLYLFVQIKRNKLDISNSMIWILLSFAVLLCIAQIEKLAVLATLLGIRAASNMLFFAGFLFLLFACVNITERLSAQRKAIIRLTQELALLKKELDDHETRK